VLIGPTAVGKTELSLELAERFGCEIISMDSMQVYRHMDIGTAKPSPEERARVPHHLIDIVNPDEQYNAALFVRDALAAIDAAAAAGRVPLLTGGTGLYLKALTGGLFDMKDSIDGGVRSGLRLRLREEGREELHAELRRLDPESAARIHVNDTQRLLRALELVKSTGRTWSSLLRNQAGPPARFHAMLQVGLRCERPLLYNRIERRAEAMLSGGLIEEVRRLHAMGYHAGLPAMQAIGYRHAGNYLAGYWDRKETLRLLVRDTRRYAKRQMTWFASNSAIRWFAREDRQGVLKNTGKWLAGTRQ
jgi:tRNA dimethylallyltransferase